MNTATITAIAQYLEVSPNQVAKVTELKWVWCVVVRGRRPRFVSKKVAAMISRSEAAKIIRGKIEAYDREDYTVKIWEKGGRCRLYIRDMGYSNSRAQTQGYFGINTDGSFNFDNIKANSAVVAVLESAVAGLEIADDPEGREEMSKPFTRKPPATIQESWSACHRQRQSSGYFFGAADEESW